MPEPQPFTLVTPPEALADLRARLRATRWPDAPRDAGWTLGADVDELRDLVDHWADGFDWPSAEARLNELPHFRTTLGGLGIHFVHARSAVPGALPIVLSHGWPDSFWRYTKVIDLLTDPEDPADAFHVVVPDMPGYGYSDAPSGPPLNSIQVAALWAELMAGLGYERFAAAGGDIGSHVSRYLGLDFGDRVIGVHRTDAGLGIFAGDPAELSPEERDWMAEAARWGAAEGAYAMVQRTKPQTAAVGLTDSPAGLAAWIVEKLRSWSDGGLAAYTRDEILTNVTIYWLTGTIGPAMRMYHANGAIPAAQHARRVEVPSGFAIFPGDIVRPPRAWMERTANAVRITEPERGGHFAAFEQPELYVRELREFYRPLRGSV